MVREQSGEVHVALATEDIAVVAMAMASNVFSQLYLCVWGVIVASDLSIWDGGA